MGMEEVQCQYLPRVEVRADLKKKKNNEQSQNREKRTFLKEVFMEKTQCSSWREVETYEP